MGFPTVGTQQLPPAVGTHHPQVCWEPEAEVMPKWAPNNCFLKRVLHVCPATIKYWCNCWLMSLLTSHCHANVTAHLEPSWANKLLLFLIPFYRLLLSLQWRLPISLICNCAEILEPWKWHVNWNTNSVDVLLPKGCIKSAKLYITVDKEIILYFGFWYYLDPSLSILE